MMRIIIVGVGAMGCLFAARLSPFADVTMVGHWAPQLDALQSGMTLITPEAGEHRVTVSVTSDPRSLTPAPIVLVLVKSYQTARSAPEIRVLLEPDGIAVTLQNGIGNKQILDTQLGSERVVLGATTEGATLVDVGVVRHAGHGVTTLPRLSDKRAGLLASFATVLREAAFNVTFSTEIEARVWEKVAVNAAINPLTALIDAPNGRLISNRAANQIARLAAEETASVARAKGHNIDPQNAVGKAIAVAQATRDNVSSMLQDVRNGRPTELEAITGAVVEWGCASGVPTPVSQALLRLLTLKLNGNDWTAAVASLPPDIQPLFLALTQEGADEDS